MYDFKKYVTSSPKSYTAYYLGEYCEGIVSKEISKAYTGRVCSFLLTTFGELVLVDPFVAQQKFSLLDANTNALAKSLAAYFTNLFNLARSYNEIETSGYKNAMALEELRREAKAANTPVRVVRIAKPAAMPQPRVSIANLMQSAIEVVGRCYHLPSRDVAVAPVRFGENTYMVLLEVRFPQYRNYADCLGLTRSDTAFVQTAKYKEAKKFLRGVVAHQITDWGKKSYEDLTWQFSDMIVPACRSVCFDAGDADWTPVYSLKLAFTLINDEGLKSVTQDAASTCLADIASTLYNTAK